MNEECSQWTCTICTFSQNKKDYLVCSMCQSLKYQSSLNYEQSSSLKYEQNFYPPTKRIKTSIPDILNDTQTSNKVNSINNDNLTKTRPSKYNNEIHSVPLGKFKNNKSSKYNNDKDNKVWQNAMVQKIGKPNQRNANTYNDNYHNHKRFESDEEDNQGGGKSFFHSTNEIDGTEVNFDIGSLDEGYIQKIPTTIIDKPKSKIDKTSLIAEIGLSINNNGLGNISDNSINTKKNTYNYSMMPLNDNNNFFEENGLADEMSHVAYDTLLAKLLSISLPTLIEDEEEPLCELTSHVPLVFKTEAEYISSFEPLLISEAIAGIMSYIQTGIGSNEREMYKGVYQLKANDQNVQCYLIKIGLVNTRRSSTILLDEIKISRVEIEKNNENQNQYNNNSELQKDDLILILKKKLTITLKNIKDAIQIPHHLAIVTEINQRENHMRLIMIKGTSPTPETVRTCIKVTSLTTYIREWIALHSIKNTTLCPLTPYILKGSPVISTSLLGQINNNLLSKYKALINITESSSAATRKKNALTAIENEIKTLQPINTDYSTLKKTDIVNTIKTIIAYEDTPSSCKDLAKSILKKWKESMKSDMKDSRIKKLRGGKLIDIPSDVQSLPTNISPVLWNKFCSSFNQSQLFAIKYIIDDSNSNQDTKISLIQGPPGTGKTSTIIGLITALLATSCKRVLVAAPSNAAVDEICRRLMHGISRSGGNVTKVSLIRMGLPLTNDQDIEKLSLEYQTEKLVQQSGGFQRLQISMKAINELQLKMQTMLQQKSGLSGEGAYRTLQQELSKHKQNKKSAENEIERDRSMYRQDLLFNAEVVIATFSGSGNKIMIEYIKNGTIPCYDTVILDEAAQATEPSSLIPLKYGCRKLVLVGDPRQLPATCLSQSANDAGLGRSLFERLENADHDVVMLTVQYRMHPDICLFPSEYFYQGKLITCDKIKEDVENVKVGIRSSNNICAEFLSHSKLNTVNFLDLQSMEEKVGQSYRNTAEICYILSLLVDISKAINSVKSITNMTIAIITPYKAQVKKLKEELTNMIRRDYASNSLIRESLNMIEINTVDGFQGREVDIVIFSCVRTNDRIGFVSDDRRLNVALTRSKRCLIIVGNAHGYSLDRNANWSALLRSLNERQFVQKVKLPYESFFN